MGTVTISLPVSSRAGNAAPCITQREGSSQLPGVFSLLHLCGAAEQTLTSAILLASPATHQAMQGLPQHAVRIQGDQAHLEAIWQKAWQAPIRLTKVTQRRCKTRAVRFQGGLAGSYPPDRSAFEEPHSMRSLSGETRPT